MRRAAVLAGGALALALALAACGGGGLPEPGAPDAERARTRYPGTTVETLAQGRTLYRSRCASCHRPVAPASIAADEWPTHVAEMKDRAGLSDADAQAVERYLVAIASRSAR